VTGRHLRLLPDTRGATTLEFALALPLLATLMVGFLQFAIVMHTSGGIRHALGEGLRFAKVNPAATAQQVVDETRASLVAIDPAGIAGINFTRGVQNGGQFGRLTITYQARPVVPFIPDRVITLSETKQIYLQS
jgi:Flp pilus assembly protein TadG